MTMIASGAIIAAGEGARLRAAGLPKPLVPVAGEPLIAHVLENFSAAGVCSVSVIFNAAEEDCAAYVRERFPKLVQTILVRTTASSLESFQRILGISPPGRVLVSTVDAFCPRDEFIALVRAAEKIPDETTVLAVTPFVSDEKPLWVRCDPTGRVTQVGGTSGDAVTAGIYVVAPRVRDLRPPESLGRLREFLAWLCDQRHELHALSIPRVVDVDRPEDVRLAEEMARETSGIRAEG
jgi:NDP-sugar pyrophosphorylase family protein